MKRFLKSLAVGILLTLASQFLWVGDVSAQQVNLYCQVSAGPPQIWGPCNGGNPLSVNASVSASITGFPTTQTTGTPLSVTTSSGAGNLPTGTVVVASNVGATNGAYCKLGATVTTSDQLIPPNSWFAFTVGSATQLACITSTSTTTVNMVGGSGLPTGSGGGGGGSGGGGAVTIASGAVASGAYSSGSIASGAVSSGAYASGALAAGAFAAGAGVDGWDLTQGAIADAAATQGSTGSISAKLRTMTAQLNTISTNTAAALPAQSVAVPIGGQGICDGANGTTNPCTTVATVKAASTIPAATDKGLVVSLSPNTPDPCMGANKTNLPISQNGTSSVQLIALSGSTVIYVCSLSLIAAGATTVALTTGTGTACVTGNAAVIGTTTASIANSMSLAANGGLTLGNGMGTIAKGAASSELCMINGSNVFVSGNLTYVQQ